MKKKQAKAKILTTKNNAVMTAQWEKVYRFREQLASKYPSPPIRRLRSFWQQVEDDQPPELLDESTFDNPLAAMMFCIKDGRYPPPEILLAVEESWLEYLHAGGLRSLEETLISKPIRNAGNYAARSCERNRRLSLASLLLAVSRENAGMSRKNAIAFAVKRFGLGIEEDTLDRIARSTTDAWIKKAFASESSKSAATSAKLYRRKIRKTEK